ncbi:TMEM165/GDT1 family protein [Thalassiella azotivora]
MDLAVALAALLVIVPVELPDKTFVATLVLSTRYRPLLVWIGVGAAFAVQTLIAVTAGGLLAQLPRAPVTAAAMLLFLAGAVLLWRSARGADEAEAEAEEEFAGRVRAGATGLRVVGTSFLVLFLAEWGDLSQLLTAGLVVRFDDPVSVFAGSWTALLLVSGTAALLGRALLRRIRLATVQRVGAGVCLLMAVVTGLELAGVPLPV